MTTNRNYKKATSKSVYLEVQYQNKRKSADYDRCKSDLEDDFITLLEAFSKAIEKANITLSNFSMIDWSRNLEASVIQSALSSILSKFYNDKVCYAKHKRLVLRLKGYLILFKKLGEDGFPMNIETDSSLAILNQSQQIELFPESNYNNLPILFFGYTKNKVGQFTNPKLLYIDNEQIQFSISEKDYKSGLKLSVNQNLFTDEVDKPLEAMPTLKKGRKKKAN